MIALRKHILKGTKFGKWKVACLAKPNKWGHTMYKCKCECGNIRNIPSTVLRRGFSTRCKACARRDRSTLPRKIHKQSDINEAMDILC